MYTTELQIHKKRLLILKPPIQTKTCLYLMEKFQLKFIINAKHGRLRRRRPALSQA